MMDSPNSQMNKKFVIRYFQRALHGASVGHSIAALCTSADEYLATRIAIKYLKFAKRKKKPFERRGGRGVSRGKEGKAGEREGEEIRRERRAGEKAREHEKGGEEGQRER